MSKKKASKKSDRDHKPESDGFMPPSFYQHFFDEAPDMFASVDPKTATIKYCNRTLCDRLGYEKEAVIGRPLKELYHPNSHREMHRVFELFVEFGEAESNHMQLMTTSGSTIDVSLRVSSRRDADGNIVESRSIWRDASLNLKIEQLELELRLQEAQKMESLAMLAGGIAHDFNNMLVAILGNASLILLELPVESPVRSKLEAIETASQRAADLTKQLMAYSGSTNHDQTHFDLSKVVQEMGHLLSVAISRKVVLNFDIPQEPVPALGDITQIRQIILNLLTNGSDAIGDRSGLITIRTGLINADPKYLSETLLGADIEPGYYAFLEVSDTGIGIGSDDQKRMFDPFFSTKSKGHGLGLAAVLGIVRAHKGTVRVYSEPGNGTSVKVLLPAAEFIATQLPDLSVTLQGNGEHILLVDDEDTVIATTKGMLEHFGFRVTTAPDGREALRIYSATPSTIDLVLMDITMPHMDGVSAYKAMVDIDPETTVILMSGYSEQKATNELTGRSFGGFIQKPFSPGALLQILAECLDLRQAGRETNR